MWGLLLLGKAVLYVVILIVLAVVTRKGTKRWWSTFLVVAIAATIPWWDLYPRALKHQELCELDGGYREYKTIPEGVESYYDSGLRRSFSWKLENYKYSFIEGHLYKNSAKVYRFSLDKDGQVEKTEVVSPESRYEYFSEFLDGQLPYELTGSRSGIRDRQTGELLASITNYVLALPWGWYFSFPLGGEGCSTISETKASLFFTEIIPAKKSLRD